MGEATEADVARLLQEAETAHGRYEAVELGGVYDQEWPRWYSEYAIEHGLSVILGREVSSELLASALAQGYADFSSADPTPSESWSAYLARRLAAEL